MQRTIILAIAIIGLAISAPEAYAQGFLRGLKDKAVGTVKDKVSDKVEREVGNAADAILDGTGTGEEAEENEGDDKPSKKHATEEDDAPAGQATYAKNDFVAGSKAFFYDDVKSEKVGEFPSMWDLVNGEEVEVATYNGEKVIKIGGWCTDIAPMMKQEDYLPEEFTIEYEVLTTGINKESRNDHLNLIMTDENSDAIMDFSLNQDGGSDPEVSYQKPNGTDGRSTASGETISKLVKKNTWTKVGVSFNTRALKIYVNGTRIINVPNMKRPTRMMLRSVSNSDERPYFFVKNIRMAQGAVELYDKKTSSNDIEKSMEETGKFVTNNILFETGKADLKIESMIEIMKVADYMKKNPSVRFEVQGHCDNQGTDAVNDPLSQKRSEAIVKALVGLGVDEWNLKAVGKGSHEPVADNKTEEGRAKNRRVEFIKR